ncbi:hypothetical protein BV25DRAFT_277004 [Artomyces pyxidatus]|uniref:Uncharacterized protein n=1 Tax=Artomyces pyxidatus TaxID=48021 RepID=A0ACB8T7C3_9AGAM|nr:hypothetical protein BV25DRAFT_277004 [Artomyces pyxidatus]
MVEYSRNADEWFQIFENVVGIEELCTANYATDAVCEALSMAVLETSLKTWQTVAGAQGEGRHFVLPELSCLHLAVAEPLSDPTFPATIEARTAARSPLRTLTVRECVVEPTWIEEMKAVVEKVEWDGYSGCDEPEGSDLIDAI